MRSKFWRRLDTMLRHGAENQLALAREWDDLPAAPAGNTESTARATPKKAF